jgi:hypothetical protein
MSISRWTTAAAIDLGPDWRCMSEMEINQFETVVKHDSIG